MSSKRNKGLVTKAKLRHKVVRGYGWERGEDWHTRYLCDDCLEKYEEPDGVTGEGLGIERHCQVCGYSEATHWEGQATAWKYMSGVLAFGIVWLLVQFNCAGS